MELKKEDATIQSVLKHLFDNLKRLINHEVPIEDLIRKSTFSGNYKWIHFL